MKSSRWVWGFRFVGVVGVLVLAGCSGGSPATGKTLVYINPNDAALIGSSDPNGAEVLGVRDQNGRPIRISEIVIPGVNNNPADRGRVVFDATQRIGKIQMDSGESASFEYVSATRVFMTIRAGTESERVPLDLLNQTGQISSGTTLQNVHPLAGGLKGKVESRCGVTPIWAEVKGSYQSTVLGGKPTPIAFIPLSNADWEYTLPVSPVNDGETIKKSKETLDQVKLLWNGICSDSITVSLATTITAQKFCETTWKTTNVEAKCKRLVNLLSDLCPLREKLLEKGIEALDSYGKEYTVVITVSYPETSYRSKGFIFTVRSDDISIPNKRSDITSDPSNKLKGDIQDFTISPLDPGPGQSYTITVSVFCAPEDTQLQISVVGTDKYTNTKVFTITSINNTASLSIPGGGASVQDTINAKILPSGPEKTTTITF